MNFSSERRSLCAIRDADTTMTTRHAVIFDIDGTLTATNAVDDECYCLAVAAELDVNPADIDWLSAAHITDSGIAHWLWQQHRNRDPLPSEIAAVRERFVSLLKDQLAASPDRFRPVPGAQHSLIKLREEGWAIAIATGGWAASARLKLRAAELPVDDIPLVCADEAVERERLLTLATERCVSVGDIPLDSIISVGDGEWDVKAARHLSLPFVGVAVGDRANRLRALGASHVVPDLEFPTLREALRGARVPKPDSAAPAA